MAQSLNSGLKSFAEKVLPRALRARLDPVQATIDAEVLSIAGAITDGQVVLDAGAGETRHRAFFQHGVYVALDSGTGDSSWDYSQLDVLGDLEQLPLLDGTIDCILCMVVLEHTRLPLRVLEEFARVLKKGGQLRLVVPFLWEEHQTPHDYFRFTRYGVQAMFEFLPMRIDLLRPMGGFFWVCARRSVNFLGFFQRGWRWLLFLFLAPFFGLLFPLILYFLDRFDREQTFSLGFVVRAAKVSN